MFGYVYDDAEEALKSRYIHTAMLDWALPPERLAAMYQKWYGSPKVYDQVFLKNCIKRNLDITLN